MSKIKGSFQLGFENWLEKNREACKLNYKFYLRDIVLDESNGFEIEMTEDFDDWCLSEYKIQLESEEK